MPKPSRRVLPVATSSAGVSSARSGNALFKYRFRYLDRLEPEFVSSALLVGSSVHAAIEHHHRQQMEAVDTVTLKEMLDVFWSEWKCRVEESPEVRFGKNEDTASVGHLAERMLAAFLASDLSDSPGVVDRH